MMSKLNLKLILTRIIFRFLKICISYFPIFLNLVLFKILHLINSTELIRGYLSDITEKKRAYLIGKLNFIKHLPLYTLDKFESNIVRLIKEPGNSITKTPCVYEVMDAIEICMPQDKIAIYKFDNVLRSPNSDIVVFDNCVLAEKLTRADAAQLVPIDDNLSYWDRINNYITIVERKETKHMDLALDMLGVHTSVWAHFLISYVPKFQLFIENLDLFKNHTCISILISDDIDVHNYELMNIYLKKMDLTDRFRFVRVKSKTNVFVKELYHVNIINKITDHSHYTHPADTVYSEMGARLIQTFFSKINLPKNDINYKILIGRGKSRNNLISQEVDKYFIDQGYILIYPHLLTIVEKIELFSHASHIVGSVSSGFANVFFANSKVKILGFFNFSRNYDPFISGYNHLIGSPYDITIISGSENNSNNLNSSFYIPLDKIKKYCQLTNFHE